MKSGSNEFSKTLSDFKSLAPKQDIDISGYEDALDEALNSDSVRNIALTGIYGAGKSSVLNSYESRHPKEKFLHIELPHFQSKHATKKSNDDEYGTSIKTIEYKIINQLLCQVDPKKIPKSLFKTKRNLSSEDRFGVIAIIVTLLFSGIFIRDFIGNNSVSVLLTNKFKESSLGLFLFTITVLLFFLCTAIVLWKIILWGINVLSIKNVKISSGVLAVEAGKNEDQSYFDLYMSDVLYLFENSGTSKFVFEDLDRFDIPLIYERLHEINVLLNKRSDDGEKTFKFIYMLKDESFDSKDRSKIFDFIIPIVPVLNASNSYEKVKATLGGIEGLSTVFLRKLSVYIDDMRLLTNISNEYKIYYNRLSRSNTALSSNKLLAMVTYKNIFPKDFSELQFGRSFINLVLSERSNVINRKISEITKNEKTIQNKIKMVEEESLKSLDELRALEFDFSEIKRIGNQTSFKNSLDMLKLLEKNNYKYVGFYGREMNFDVAQNESSVEFKNRASIITEDKDKKINELKTETNRLSGKEVLLRSAPFSGIFKENKEIFDLAKENEFSYLADSPYFSLIPFLLRDEEIDEHYIDYIAYFYPGDLSKNDKEFLRKKFDGVQVSYMCKLDSPKEVMQYIGSVDISRYAFENVDLAEYLLNREGVDDEYLESLIRTIKNDDKNGFGFVHELFARLKQKEPQKVSVIIHLFKKYWPNYLSDLSGSFMSLDFRQGSEFIIDVMKWSELDDLNSQDKKVIKNWVKTYPGEFVQCISDKDVEGIFNELKELKVEFQFITTFVPSNIKMAVERNLVMVNTDTIKTILAVLSVDGSKENQSRFLSIVEESSDESIAQFVKYRIVEILNWYIQVVEKNRDTPEVVLSIANNSGLDDDLVFEYLKLWNNKLRNIEEVKIQDRWSLVVEAGKMSITSDNVVLYLRSKAFVLDDDFAKQINESSNILSFYDYKDEDERKKLFDSITENLVLNKDQYASMTQSLNLSWRTSEYSDNVKPRLGELISIGVVKITLPNVKKIRSEEPEFLIALANKNASELISVADDVGFTNEDYEKIIYSDKVDDRSRIEVIKKYGKPLDVTKIAADSKSVAQSLEFGILESNIDFVISAYGDFSKDVRLSILKDLSAHLEALIASNASKRVISDFLDAQLDIECRQLVFAGFLKLFSISEVIDYIDKLGYPQNFIEVLNRGRRTVQDNNVNSALAESFLNRQWITKKELVPDGIRMQGRAVRKKE